MKRAHFGSIICVTLVLFLLSGISTLGIAGVETLKIEISDVVSVADAIKIRRLLSPWADAKDITFHKPVDKKGRERHFSTVVEVKPRQGVSEYSHTNTFDVYDIMRQLKDSRYRGRHGVGQVRILKTSATVRGKMFSHPGFTRSSIREIPAWARWRPHTSEILHALTTENEGQNFVFKPSPEYDQLRMDATTINNEVEVQVDVVGFDGPYPILRVRDYKVGFRVKKQNTPQEKNAEKPTEEEKPKPKYDYIEQDR